VVIFDPIPFHEMPFTTNFCITLFDTPQNTQIQSDPLSGLVIASLAPTGIIRNVILRPDKIEVKAETPMLVRDAWGRIFQYYRSEEKNITIKMYGLNYEFDFRVDGVTDSSLWLGTRFTRTPLNVPKDATVKIRSVRFDLDKVGRLSTLRLEERAGEGDRIFAYANLHNDGGRMLLGEQLEAEIERGYRETIDLVSSLLGDREV
jgi:hypothetical protein